LVRVRKYQDEINYSDEIEEFFSKFKQGDVANYLVDLKFKGGMNHIEANILDCVVKLYPEVFTELDQFCIKYSDFADQRIIRFDREIQFYISYIAFISDLKENGLKFCFPRVMKQKKNIFAYDAFDIALVKKLLNDDQTIVCNDFQLRDKERIFVITGPNQGGKTTFARMFGQMHLLASLGCPVPGGKAQLFLFDRIFTHFEREEDIRNLRGKLKDDLVRIQNVLDHATSHSIIIINEIFTSTSLQDAILLGKRILEKIILIDALSVCVTFIDELTELGEQTVSLMSTVFPENPLLRTFKIIRKPADGLSYAHSIAEKHRLTYDEIIGRIGQ
jgi:DNA mismatch repair ATPase MutS